MSNINSVESSVAVTEHTRSVQFCSRFPFLLSHSVVLKALRGVKAVGTSASRAAVCCLDALASQDSLICIVRLV